MNEQANQQAQIQALLPEIIKQAGPILKDQMGKGKE
jgi:hypothetical protein